MDKNWGVMDEAVVDGGREGEEGRRGRKGKDKK